MTRIAVTGSTGHLGRLAIEHLLAAGTSPGDIVAIARDASRAADLADRGVDVRIATYADQVALEAALSGVERLLLVSGSDIGQRATQHATVIAAAATAGVTFIAYTSAPHADDTTLELAREHLTTERALAASGIAHALLRNGWYVENYLGDLAGTVERGALAGAAGDGVVAFAARADLAQAAAIVVAGEGHDGAVYELGGERLTMAGLAAAITEATGSSVTYHDLPVEAYEQLLLDAGLPAPFAAVLAQSDTAIAAGDLDITTGDLERLLGRATTPVAAVVRDAFARLQQPLAT